jgi:curved DNA-binding protein CbpA
MDEIADLLTALGLKPGATPRYVKQAYRDLMMVWHPDHRERQENSI